MQNIFTDNLSGKLLTVFLFIGVLTGLFLFRSSLPGPSKRPLPTGNPVVVHAGQTTEVRLNLDMPSSFHRALLVPGRISTEEDPVNDGPRPPGSTRLTVEDFPAISSDGVSFGGARRIAVQDGTAYVADWFSGLHVYDIRDPENPALISSFPTPGSPKDVLIHKDTVIIADDDFGITLIDVRDPLHPKKRTHLQTPGLAYGMAFSNDILYLASHRGGFQTIDLSDINHPRILGDSETPGRPWGIDISGNTVFIADDTSGILVFDVSNPEQPRKTGVFNPGGQAEDIIVRGEHAFAVFFDKGLYILGVRDPSKPELIAHLPTPGNARGVDIRGQHAYVADWKAGVHVVDIADITQPFIAGTHDTDGAAWGVRVQGNQAFVMDWWGGFIVLDVSRPSSPRLSGRYHGTGIVEDLSLMENYAFLANGTRGVQVFDIRNPFNPMWVTGLDELKSATTLFIEDGLAFIGSEGNRFSIVDVTNPFNLKKVTEIKTPLPVNRIRVKGGQAYLSDLQSGITVYDITDTARPVELFFYAGKVNDFNIDGKHLYLATDNGMDLLDLTDPAKPNLIHHVATENPVRLIQARKQVVFLYEDETGIHVLSREDDKPGGVSPFDPGEPLRDMKISRDTLYAMTESSTLLELDISDPGAVAIRGLTPSDIPGIRLEVSENAVFFAGENILRAIRPAPPSKVIHAGKGNFSMTLSEDMPPGIYDLVLMGPEGSREVYPHAVRVALPPVEEALSLEDYKKLLKEECPTCPQ